MRLPILIINMKVYPEVLGKKALELAKVAESVARELGVSIAVAPPITELRTVAEGVEIPVYAQGADPVEPGARTGHVPLEFIKELAPSVLYLTIARIGYYSTTWVG